MTAAPTPGASPTSRPSSRPAFGPGRLARLGRLVQNGLIGTFLVSTPVTSVIALGWLARKSGHHARDRFGIAEEQPGWLFGPHERQGRETGGLSRWLARWLGGLAANIRAGMMMLTALMAWTLPFTLLWLGAWWAGWENSFNKGYEQAFVGPGVFLLGTLIAALILPVLPLVFAHTATEDRLSAAFELRRLRALVVQAGWRVPALMALTTAAALPFAGVRGLITTATAWAPQLEDLSPDHIAAIQGQINLALAAVAFLSLWVLRALAARIYARAAPRAAGRRPGLWDSAHAAEAAGPAPAPSRLLTALWYGLAMAITLAFSFLVLGGQFLDHAWWRWVFHPALTLPWAG